MDFSEILGGVKILIVDDEEVLAWSIATELKKYGALADKALTAGMARKLFQEFNPDLVICDLNLPDGNGLDLLQEWHKVQPSLPVILITAHGAVETAISAVRLSAFDYLQKPFDMKDLLNAVRRAAEIATLRQKVRQMEGVESGREEVVIVGKSDAIKDLQVKLKRVAATNTDTVLVYGETGSGKELAARAVHHWSANADKPYIEINCASIPENLLESELFGYERGAFTDARTRKLGLFEMAKDGTIFLDEIGEMPLKLQSKLLRALEYRKFKRLGGVKDIEFNARIVAATNRRLIDEVVAKRFRADLYYRLSVVPLRVPSLRERQSDIRVLSDFFMNKICQQFGIGRVQIASDAYARLESHDWPGNVRELRNVLQRAVVLEAPSILRAEQISIEVPSRRPEVPVDVLPDMIKKENGALSEVILPDSGIALDEVERSLLNQAMQRAQFNQSKAASLLGITRHTLRYRLEKHDLLPK